MRSKQHPKSTIPALATWNMYAGGTGAAGGKHSYDFYTPSRQQYSISPYTTRNGRHAGYLLGVAPSETGGLHAGIRANGEETHPGAPSSSYRSPQAAVKAARAHAALYGGRRGEYVDTFRRA